MAKTRSMTRDQNHDDASSSSKKIFKTFDNDGVAPWSDLNHDVLFLVMMQLGVVDFLAFSGVCKSWRSFTLYNRNTFMASRPPMSIDIHRRANNQDSYCYLGNFDGRRFKTHLPNSAGRIFCGVTCGYLILFGSETQDFWLVNPITRHQLHFPDFPVYVGPYDDDDRIRAILLFSPSISGWVFVTLYKKIVYYIVGKQGWNKISPNFPILDLHAFKGKIYIVGGQGCELKFDSNWTLLETKNFPKLDLFYPELVSSGENLYVVDRLSKKVLELDFGKMEWVSPEKTRGQYAIFFSVIKSCAAIKPESWPGPQRPYKSYDYYPDIDEMVYSRYIWYFPHDCLKVNLLEE